jgi:hypothetical protein
MQKQTALALAAHPAVSALRAVSTSRRKRQPVRLGLLFISDNQLTDLPAQKKSSARVTVDTDDVHGCRL